MGVDIMKKRVVSVFTALFAFFVFATSTYAATTAVSLPTNVHSRQSALMSVREGYIHIEVRSNNHLPVEYGVYRYLPGRPDQQITSGTVTSSTAYPRKVTSGRYYIVLTCKAGHGYGCDATGNIHQ
jgi:hypothetical protein